MPKANVILLPLNLGPKSGSTEGDGPIKANPNAPVLIEAWFVTPAEETAESTVFIKSGASSDIDKTLYLDNEVTASLLSCCFFVIKYDSSDILFLSEEGKDSHTLPSSAS